MAGKSRKFRRFLSSAVRAMPEVLIAASVIMKEQPSPARAVPQSIKVGFFSIQAPFDTIAPRSPTVCVDRCLMLRVLSGVLMKRMWLGVLVVGWYACVAAAQTTKPATVPADA